MKVVNGVAFPDSDEFMVGQTKADGTYQAGNLEAALRHVTDFSCAVDGGAHVGTWSRTLAARFARVVAFEPAPDTYEALVANMAAFGCANVETHQAALGAVPGAISLTLDPANTVRKNTGGRYVVEGDAIPRVTLDSLALPSLGFFKLDVEGSEPLALMGARATLKRCGPVVLFENKGLWKRLGMRADAPHAILKQAGYKFLVRASCDEIWGPS